VENDLIRAARYRKSAVQSSSNPSHQGKLKNHHCQEFVQNQQNGEGKRGDICELKTFGDLKLKYIYNLETLDFSRGI
jgi:hypothetical protein